LVSAALAFKPIVQKAKALLPAFHFIERLSWERLALILSNLSAVMPVKKNQPIELV